MQRSFEIVKSGPKVVKWQPFLNPVLSIWNDTATTKLQIVSQIKHEAVWQRQKTHDSSYSPLKVWINHFIKNLCRTDTAGDGIQSAKPSGLIELVNSFELNHDSSYNMWSYTSMTKIKGEKKGSLWLVFLEKWTVQNDMTEKHEEKTMGRRAFFKLMQIHNIFAKFP